VVKALRYNPKGLRFDSRWCHWNFSVKFSSLSHYGPLVNRASNINEYQLYFLGCKGGQCIRLITLPPPCAVVIKSGKRSFLETSGPLQGCKGKALHFYSSYIRLDVFNLLVNSLCGVVSFAEMVLCSKQHTHTHYLHCYMIYKCNNYEYHNITQFLLALTYLQPSTAPLLTQIHDRNIYSTI
jgi:hypothetical protein